MGSSSRSGRARRIVVGIALATLTTIGLAELSLQLFPSLLPKGYRDRFPLQGIEFLEPGLLARTPIDALPLPLREAYEGPPPADIQVWGIAPSDDDTDRREYPHVRFPADALGLPNENVLDRADVLFIGDSFVVGTSNVDPPGLHPAFEERTGRTVYNLGVSGIGPTHELWLLENHGLPLEPELVLWFFYAGNDLVDERHQMDREAEGIATWADKPDYVPTPMLRLPSLLFPGAPENGDVEGARDAPLPGFRVPSPTGEASPIWFLPDNLWRLGLDEASWRGHRAWPRTLDTLRRARDATRAAGAELVVVFLPSKEQVYWPVVERDDALLARFLSWGSDAPQPVEPAAFTARTLANRGLLEALVEEACAADGIPFFSARPILDACAARGELVYLASDSHWDPEGQRALLDPLLEFLRGSGLL